MASPRIQAWRDRGRFVEIDGRAIFTVRTGPDSGAGRPVVIVHGYPGSSFDFADVVDQLERPVFALDLLGYGLSDKPRGASYSLFEQADLVEAVLARAGIAECDLVAHDMGDTVVAELLSRAHHKRLGFTVGSVALLNGSIFIDLAHLTRGQRLGLLARGRALPISFPEAFLRRNIAESVAPGTNLGAAQIDELVELIQVNHGDRLLTKQISYIRERRRHQEQWTAGFTAFPGRLTAIWGVLDPIAVPAMPERLTSLRPATEVVYLEGVGHWPSIEAPDQVARELVLALG